MAMRVMRPYDDEGLIMKLPKFLRMDSIKAIKHQKITPVYCLPGDSMHLSYTDENGVTKDVMSEIVTESYLFDEAIIFAIDDENHKGLGGAFLEGKK